VQDVAYLEDEDENENNDVIMDDVVPVSNENDCSML
jgi:hypothetical protein